MKREREISSFWPLDSAVWLLWSCLGSGERHAVSIGALWMGGIGEEEKAGEKERESEDEDEDKEGEGEFQLLASEN